MKSRCLQQACGSCCLLAFVLASQGLIPAWTAPPVNSHHAGDENFACASHGCGCVTAEMCWTQCCCFTRAHRLAWAAEHHVTPPLQVAPMVTQVAADAPRGCHAEKTDEPAPSTSNDNSPAGPAFSALKCQGLWQWIVVAVPYANQQDKFPTKFQPASSHRAEIEPELALDSQILDVTTPPPRA